MAERLISPLAITPDIGSLTSLCLFPNSTPDILCIASNEGKIDVRSLDLPFPRSAIVDAHPSCPVSRVRPFLREGVGDNGLMLSCAFDPDPDIKGTIGIWKIDSDTSAGISSPAVLPQGQFPTDVVQVSPNRFVVVGTFFMAHWDLEKQVRIQRVKMKESHCCCALGESRSVIFNGKVMRDLRSGVKCGVVRDFMLRVGDEPWSVCVWSDDVGQKVAVGSESSAIVIRDARTLDRLGARSGHRKSVRCLKHIPSASAASVIPMPTAESQGDRDVLISGSCDKTLRLWDPCSRLNPTLIDRSGVMLGGHADFVRDVEWTGRESCSFVSVCDSTARIWRRAQSDEEMEEYVRLVDSRRRRPRHIPPPLLDDD